MILGIFLDNINANTGGLAEKTESLYGIFLCVHVSNFSAIVVLQQEPNFLARLRRQLKDMGHVSHLVIKCLGTLVLLIFTIICGIIPIRVIRMAKSQNVGSRKANRMKLFVGCCNCFAGGVFFSICLLDLLPEVREKMISALREVNIYTTYPLGESIASVGFILMVFTEIVVHSLGKGTILMDHMHNHDEPDEEEEPLISDQPNTRSYGSHYQPKSLKVVKANGDSSLPRDDSDFLEQDFEPSTPILEDGNVFQERRAKSKIRRSKSLRSISSVNTVVHSSFRMYILITALSLHSLFEGLSVGLITDIDTLVQLLIGLLLHKSILSFALGIKLVDGGLKPTVIIKGIIVFAAMAPLGVGLGLAVLSSFSRVASLFCSGILQGLATGSFLYVTFFEILPEEFTIQSRHKVKKLLSVILGFLIIAGMCYYENQFKYKLKKVPPNATPTLLSATVAALVQNR